MSGLLKANLQLGDSATATQNFTLSVPATPDGTVKLARGNAGATTQDILTVDASGNVNAPIGIQKAGSVLQALSDFTGSNVSLASSGYQKLPSGLIIQWVPWSKPAGSSATVVVNLPITFPNAAIAVWSSASNNVFPLGQSISTTQITLGANAYWSNTSNLGGGTACAIGY